MDDHVICPYLWNHQNIDTEGKVAPCCNAYMYEEWTKLDFNDKIDTPLHKRTRQEMIQGNFPEVCSVCRVDENEGVQSARERAIEQFGLPIDLNKSKITFLDIAYSNTCNLACVMCKPSDSSIIEEAFRDKRGEDIPHYLHTLKANAPWMKWNDFARSQEKVVYTKQLIEEGLLLLKVTGGEPTACKYFLEVIDWSIENNYAKNLSLRFTTNATKFNKKLIEKMKKFKSITVNVSIDGTDNVYNYIRHHGNFDKVKENLYLIKNFKNEMKDDPKKVKITMATVLQFYNMFEMPALAKLATDIGASINIDVNLKPEDHEFDIKFAPIEFKEKLISDCEQILRYYNYHWSISKFQNVIKYAEKVKDYKVKESDWKKLFESTRALDKLNNKKVKDFLPTPISKYIIRRNDYNTYNYKF